MVLQAVDESFHVKGAILDPVVVNEVGRFVCVAGEGRWEVAAN